MSSFGLGGENAAWIINTLKIDSGAIMGYDEGDEKHCLFRLLVNSCGYLALILTLLLGELRTDRAVQKHMVNILFNLPLRFFPYLWLYSGSTSLFITLSSTLRFCSLPSCVALSALGMLMP